MTCPLAQTKPPRNEPSTAGNIDVEYSKRWRVSRREQSLDTMDAATPWPRWVRTLLKRTRNSGLPFVHVCLCDAPRT